MSLNCLIGDAEMSMINLELLMLQQRQKTEPEDSLSLSFAYSQSCLVCISYFNSSWSGVTYYIYIWMLSQHIRFLF